MWDVLLLVGSCLSTCETEIHGNSGLSADEDLRGRNILSYREFMLRKCSNNYPLATVFSFHSNIQM